MTTEPRREANAAVSKLSYAVSNRDAVTASDQQVRLVDALAAAKRAEDAHRVYEDVRMSSAGDMAEGDALDELRGALSDLSEALSALREDET